MGKRSERATTFVALTASGSLLFGAPVGPVTTHQRHSHSRIHRGEAVVRPFSKPRHDVISKTPALQEREQTKIAGLADVLAIALKERGATELQALLAARSGMAAFALATVAWLDDPSLALGERLDLAFGELKSMLNAAAA